MGDDRTKRDPAPTGPTYSQAQLENIQTVAEIFGLKQEHLFTAVQVFKSVLRSADVELPPLEHSPERSEEERTTIANAPEPQLQQPSNVAVIETLDPNDLVLSFGEDNFTIPDATNANGNPDLGLDIAPESASAGANLDLKEPNTQIGFPAYGLSYEPAFLPTENLLSSSVIANENGLGGGGLDMGLNSMTGALSSSNFATLPDFFDYSDMQNDYLTIQPNTSGILDNIPSAFTSNGFSDVGVRADYLGLEPGAIFDFSHIPGVPMLPAGSNDIANAPQNPESSTIFDFSNIPGVPMLPAGSNDIANAPQNPESSTIFDFSNIPSVPMLPAGSNDIANAPPNPGSSTYQSLAVLTRSPTQPSQHHPPDALEVIQVIEVSNKTAEAPRQSGSQTNSHAPPKKRKRSRNGEIGTDQRARRKAFEDESVRQATACTRKHGACIRCRLQRIRCLPNEDDPRGPCLTCLQISGPTMYYIPCLRYKLSDVRLLDHDICPRPTWTTRWKKMVLVDLKDADWLSIETKTISLTQDVGGLSINLTVRQFIPQTGVDTLARYWVANGQRHSYECAAFAIENMTATGEDYKKFVDANLASAISHYTEDVDPLIRHSYEMAYKYSQISQEEDERKLLLNVMRLWMGSRMETRSDRISSIETLGMLPCEVEGINKGKILVPPVLTAQQEIIITTIILQPAARDVLKGVQKLIDVKRPKAWFCIYLVMFILLHSCSLLTHADNKKARKQGDLNRFYRTALVEELHNGAKVLLAHFHFCNRGAHPFTLDWSQKRNVLLAGLNAEQVEFIQDTLRQVKEKAAFFKGLRDEEGFEHDWFFLSQLYDQAWTPIHTI